MPDYHQITPCRLFAKRVGESLKSGLCGLQQTVKEACDVIDKCPNHTELLELFAKVRRQTIELEGLLTVLELETGLLPEIPGFNEVVKAAERLAKRRHGAIIALERQMKLDEFIEEGKKAGLKLQAELSSRLLECIFYPGNPLHDGAVVVRDIKILAAGCVLPLSKQEISADHYLGTRHRAALGLSELTDAIVVTVSEETGHICLALGGRLYCVDNYTNVRRDIINFLAKQGHG